MRRLALALAAVCVAVAACSSSGETADPAGTTAPASPAQTAPGTTAPAPGAVPSTPAPTTAPAATSPPVPTPTPTPDAAANVSCTLLTADEISAAAGVAFEPGAPSAIATAQFQDACDWATADGSATAQLIVVSLDVYSQNRASAAAASTDGATDVSIAGADAAYSAFNGAIVGMQVGGRFVQLAVLVAGTDQSQAAISLSELVLSRL